MREQELLESIRKYHNDIVDKCHRTIAKLEDQKTNLPWEDMTDWHRGYMEAIKDGLLEIEKERII